LLKQNFVWLGEPNQRTSWANFGSNQVTFIYIALFTIQIVSSSFTVITRK